MYKVLLVDDEEMVTQGLKRFVPWEEEGYTVAGTATSVARALVFLESESVDLVITDIQMPVQNGLDLIGILKEKYPHIKSVLLSGYSEFSYAQQALRLGAVDYLTKPVNFTAMRGLLQKVREMLDEEKYQPGDDRMRELLVHTLIMNFANGYPYDEARASTCLNTGCPITVVRVASREKAPLSDAMVEHFKAQFGPCQVVFQGGEELLAVLEGVRCLANLSKELTTFVEQLDYMVPLCVGVSEQQPGYSALRVGALQAAKAIRYQNARSGAGVMLYEQVRKMFVSSEEDADAVIRELVELLATPEKREQLIPAFTSALASLETKVGFTMEKAQHFCIEFLVELDAPVERLSLPDYARHVHLSEVLMDVLAAKNIPEMSAFVTQYLQQLIEKIMQMDEAKLAGELIDRIKDYIQEHFAENLTLAVLSEVFFVSPVYLSRLFKRKTGTNFVEYLTDLRMEKAKQFLQDPSLKVYHVAEMVGYENPRYFARLFKEATGYVPQEYRAMQQGESVTQ